MRSTLPASGFTHSSPSLSFQRASLDLPRVWTVSRCQVSLGPGVGAGVACLGSEKMFAVGPVGQHKPNIQPTETQERLAPRFGWSKPLTNKSNDGVFLKTYLVFHAFLWKWPLQGHVARVNVSAPGFCGWNLSSHATLETHGLSIGSSVQALGWKPSISPSFNHHSCHGLVTPHVSLLRTLKERTAKKFAQSCTADEDRLEG